MCAAQGVLQQHVIATEDCFTKMFKLMCFVRTVAFVGTVVLVRLAVGAAPDGTSTIPFVMAATSSATKDCAVPFAVKPTASLHRTKWCSVAYARGNLFDSSG